MRKVLLPSIDSQTFKKSALRGASPFDRVKQGKTISKEELAESLTKIRDKINEGLFTEADPIVIHILETYSNTIDTQAKLNQLLSLSLELQGKFEESLQTIQHFENERVIDQLTLEKLTLVFIQIARAYANTNEFPRAVALLNSALQIAEEKEFIALLVETYLAFSNVYKELNEYPISRNFADKAQNTPVNWVIGAE